MSGHRPLRSKMTHETALVGPEALAAAVALNHCVKKTGAECEENGSSIVPLVHPNVNLYKSSHLYFIATRWKPPAFTEMEPTLPHGASPCGRVESKELKQRPWENGWRT